MIVLVFGYFGAEAWLYKVSGLSKVDAILLDIPVTLAFVLVGVVIPLAIGESDTGYWPTAPKC